MYRELVFDCAERVFAEQGFEETAMHDIAAEAGVSLNTVYAAFAGKNELYDEIRRVRGHAFLEAMVVALHEAGSIRERLARGCRGYVDFLLAHRDFFQLLLREGRSWGLDPAPESRVDWGEGLRVVADLLRDGMAEGVFYDGDPDRMAATGFAIMQVQLAGLLASEESVDADAIANEIQEILERVYCRPGVREKAPRRLAV